MLLARQAVRLHDAPATEGTLLSTLLRSPSVVATFTGPLDSRPQRLAVAPDGHTLAVSDNQSTVRFYDTNARKQVAVLHQLGFTSAVTYGAAGDIFVAPAFDRVPVIDVRNAHTRRLIGRLPPDHRFLTHPTGFSPQIVLSADERNAYYAYDVLKSDGVTDGPAYVDRWDVSTTRLIASVPVGADGAFDLRLVDGGRRLAVAGTTTVTFLDPMTLRRVGSVPLPRHAGAVVLSPTGRQAAVAGSAGGVSFVDLGTGRVRVGDAAHAAPVSTLGFSPSGRLLVSGAEDGSLIVWDAQRGQSIRHLYGQGGRMLGIAFGRKDASLFTCGLDGAIFEWDLGTGRGFGRRFGALQSATRPHLSGDTQFHAPPLAVAPDSGTFAVRLGSNRIGLVSATSGRRLATFAAGVGPEVAAVAWSNGGRLAVAGDAGRIRLWNVSGQPRPGRLLRGLGSRNGEPEVVTAVAFSPDGRLVAAGDVNHTPPSVQYRFGTVAVADAATGRLLWSVRSRRGTVNSLAFSPGGETLAVGYEDGTVALDDVRTGNLTRRLRLEGGGNFTFETLTFSPTGTLATGTWSGIVQLWNPATGIEIGKPTLVAAAPVASISFDPSGQTFATSGGSDGLVKLWTTSTLQQFAAAFPGDPGQWGSVRFTPDGKNLVVVYEDQSGFLWPSSPRAWEQHACAVAHRQFTHEEWLRFVGRRRYAPTC
jgi:WD40 repeat protein